MVGSAGTDGLGGGGAGGFRGGSGVVIIRYVPAHSKAFAARGGAISMDGEYRVHTFASNGTFTMPCNGLVDILLVGGGGGGGEINEKRAAGGGAGGLVYMTNVVLAAGAHAIAVGSGGAIGANGGNTSLSANIAGITKTFTAYGGGAGTRGDTTAPGAAGGSGGGAVVAYADSGSMVPGGAAAYAAEDNIGHAGAGATHFWGCGGGGGAGSSPTKRNCNGVDYAFNLDWSVKPEGYPNESGWVGWPSWGGDGLAIGITGESVYYAGGGAAARIDGDNNAQGGLGGGGGYMNRVGSAGTDGLGGGGAGGFRGGSGVAIIRYRFAPSCTVLSMR